MLLPHNWHFFWSFSMRGYFSSISTSGKDPWKISTRGVEVGEVNVNWKKQKLLQLRKISCVIYRKQNFFLQGKKSRKRFLRKNNHLGNSSPSPHDAAFLLSRLPFVCVVVQLYHDICRVNELFFLRNLLQFSRNSGTFVAFSPATKLQSMLMSFCHKSWKCCRIGKTFPEESQNGHLAKD